MAKRTGIVYRRLDPPNVTVIPHISDTNEYIFVPAQKGAFVHVCPTCHKPIRIGPEFCGCPGNIVFGRLAVDNEQDEDEWERIPQMCGDCGTRMQIVRPGKWQCLKCE
jgi:hypothetical protein